MADICKSGSESASLLDTILRKEWGFDGLVMSDCREKDLLICGTVGANEDHLGSGTYSCDTAVNAGLDLEM